MWSVLARLPAPGPILDFPHGSRPPMAGEDSAHPVLSPSPNPALVPGAAPQPCPQGPCSAGSALSPPARAVLRGSRAACPGLSLSPRHSPCCKPQEALPALEAPVPPQNTCSNLRILEGSCCKDLREVAEPRALPLCCELGGRGQQRWPLLASQLHHPLPPTNPALQPTAPAGHRTPQQGAPVSPQHQGMEGTSTGHDLSAKNKVSLRKVHVFKSPVWVPWQPWLCCYLCLGPLSRCPT